MVIVQTVVKSGRSKVRMDFNRKANIYKTKVNLVKKGSLVSMFVNS